MANLKSKWFWLCVILVLWFIGGFGICWEVNAAASPEIKTLETIKTIFLVLGGLGVVLPTYFNIWQSLETSENLKDKIRFDIVENTYRLIEKWDDAAILAARKLCREIGERRTAITDQALLEQIKGNEDLKQSVILIFNYWENVRVSILNKRIDERMIEDSLRPAFLQLYRIFEPWLKSMDSESQKDMNWLWKRWQQNAPD